MTVPIPSRGEVWMADLDPVLGHEQGGRRPVLVVSDDRLNHSPAELAVIVPLTSRLRRIASRVRVSPPEGGLRLESDILCDAVRSISTRRLIAHQGWMTQPTLERVEDTLRFVLKLFRPAAKGPPGP